MHGIRTKPWSWYFSNIDGSRTKSLYPDNSEVRHVCVCVVRSAVRKAGRLFALPCGYGSRTQHFCFQLEGCMLRARSDIQNILTQSFHLLLCLSISHCCLGL
jgi:hypothetical protein